MGRNRGRTEPDRGDFLRQQTVPVVLVVRPARPRAGGGHQGAGRPQVGAARVGRAGVQRVLGGGAAPTPPPAPAGPVRTSSEIHRDTSECWEEIQLENVNAGDI